MPAGHTVEEIPLPVKMNTNSVNFNSINIRLINKNKIYTYG